MDEACPDCGAERPRWHGGSHVARCHRHGTEHARCCDGKTPEEFWADWIPPFSDPSTWPRR